MVGAIHALLLQCGFFTYCITKSIYFELSSICVFVRLYCSAGLGSLLTLAPTFGSMQEGATQPPAPPPSCLSDASVLLATLLRYTPDESTAVNLKVEVLLHVWAHLIADWNAWVEEEDESVFDTIEEAVAFQVSFSQPHSFMGEILLTLIEVRPSDFVEVSIPHGYEEKHYHL